MDLAFVLVIIIRKILLAKLVKIVATIALGQAIRNVLLVTQHKSSKIIPAYALMVVINPLTLASPAPLLVYHAQVPTPAPYAIIHSSD